jgi:hypothetical protein
VVARHHTLARPADRTDRLPDDEHHHLRNADELRSLLERHGVGLVLSGHLHWPSVGRVGTVRELVAPSTCSYPPSYLLLSVDPRGVIARMVPVAGVEGTAAAFRAATRASDRPRTLAESVVEGYFDRFPLLDDRPAERLAGRP